MSTILHSLRLVQERLTSLAFMQCPMTDDTLDAGDDDTILFLDSAMNLVKDLDPEMPYFLTGQYLPVYPTLKRFHMSVHAAPPLMLAFN